jgi:hypothetical protein
LSDLPDHSQLHQFPLHVRPLKRLTWDEADAAIPPIWREDFDLAKSAITSPWDFIVETTLDHTPREATHITESDLNRLLEHGIVEDMPDSEVCFGDCRVFSVLEQEKQRRRLIIEPMINDILFFTGNVQLPSLDEILRPGSLNGASCFDFTAYYNQFELPLRARNWYCFAAFGRVFRLRVIATGQRQCPAMAHILTTSIALTAANGTGAEPTTFIDNVRFAGLPTSTELATRNFIAACETIGITVSKEPCNAHQQQYTFLGIEFNHSTKQAALSEKTRRKMADKVSQITAGISASWSMRCFLSTLSLIIWGMRVVDIPLARAYHLIKFARRRAPQHLDSPANVWPSIIPCMLDLLGTCSNHHRDLRIPRRSELVLFSDASLQGWGAVFINGHRVNVHAGRFAHPEHINILEARAICFAIQFVDPQPKPTMIKILIDNTTVLAGIRGGSGWGGVASHNYCLAMLSLHFAELCKERNIIPTVEYVRSAENLADLPSRLMRAFHASFLMSH